MQGYSNCQQVHDGPAHMCVWPIDAAVVAMMPQWLDLGLDCTPSPVITWLVRESHGNTSLICHCVMLCDKQERTTSSAWQTAFNAINVLCGVGLLTTPYTMAITGTSALLLLVVIGRCRPADVCALKCLTV